jgi:hypothetical protein
MPRVARTVVNFFREFLARDRYLTEALAALVTFAVGVVASVTIDQMETRVSLAGFRDMPCPEALVALASVPGIISAAKLIWEGERREGLNSLAVMSSFVALSAFSFVADLGSWAFWTLFTLLLGVMKGYALVREWTYLRWSVAVLGAFFWVNFTTSIAMNLPDGLKILAVAPAGFAVANLLSVSRLSGRRGNG